MTPSTGPSSMLDPANAPADVLERDLGCLHCGYNLRGISTTSACPECGMAISVSLRQDTLLDAPADWLIAVRRGADMLYWGVLLSLPLLPVGLVLACLGLWRITLAEPQRVEPWTDRRVRLGARVFCTTGTVVLSLLLLAVVFAVLDRQYRFDARWMQMDTVLIGAAVVCYLGWLAMWQVLRNLALRMPDSTLPDRCRAMQRHWLIGLGLIIGIALVANAGNLIYAATTTRLDWAAPVLVTAVAATLVWLWVVTLRFAGTWCRAIAALTP